MRTCLIAAVSENGVIGINGDLPWRIRSDMIRFKHLTVGNGGETNAVIMGRKTWESLPDAHRPLEQGCDGQARRGARDALHDVRDGFPAGAERRETRDHLPTVPRGEAALDLHSLQVLRGDGLLAVWRAVRELSLIHISEPTRPY